ncbi:MAG: GDP-mannose 4,6-dehydratase [Acholeplasmatales bacterium]|nr:GDP-mannose 4,6-dehydratase [Acholeplasmatales bacterium]
MEAAFKVIGIRITWKGEGIDTKGINDVTGNVLVEIDPNLYRVNDNKYLKGDSTKAKETLGWEPKHKFVDIVEKMVRTEITNK